MDNTYYLCFQVNKIPDLTLTKYSVFDSSSVESIMDKHGVFLRQLHRLGYTSGVYFHLLYYYNPSKKISRGRHLSIIFYATSRDRSRLEGIREFLTTSVLSNYYDFYCYEVANRFEIAQEQLDDGSSIPVLRLYNISGQMKKYALGTIRKDVINRAKADVQAGRRSHVVCGIASDADVVLSFNSMPVDAMGRITLEKKFAYGAFLTKKDYSLLPRNQLDGETSEVQLYSLLEWEPCETGRLYNVLKLMEGYNQHAVLRIDIFPFEHNAQRLRDQLPYRDTRRRISDRFQGKDDNSEAILKSWDSYLNNLMKFPLFRANIVAFADSRDVAVMLADSVAAEAVESGTYLIETIESGRGFDMYESDSLVLQRPSEAGNYMIPFLSLYTLEEMRPMFSFPILYPGESIECQKETDPVPFQKAIRVDDDTGEIHEVMSLGVSALGYDVTFPLELYKKHAFIAGVPGAGKTNTMLYLVTSLWRNTFQKIPFLVLEPAKQEYRALALQKGMEDLCIFSPGADTRFPLHINPFQFPVGLTLAEHIANLNAVFAGAFELPPPSPHFIDTCIEKVYLNKGWNINERNTGKREYPTLQELYASLEEAVMESHYQGETLGNLRSVLEVRVGSLLKREIGNVYNVRKSIIEPEEWLLRPVIIELESLGEGPANFMSLLISTLIREVLKVRKTSDTLDELAAKRNEYLRAVLPSDVLGRVPDDLLLKPELEHVIFYEEAHNLIGPNTDSPAGDSVDPKISATKFLVKMLAEVRALGEGIVIADQLPTAMAPEVLKNTGLKLGHRITAQDDRNLLGSTMSASADQLEEQGTFGTGWALIFYENLLKPFKMRACEWEKGVSKEKYRPPTNARLFDRIKDRPNYRNLLESSCAIMQDKMRAEFDVQRLKAEELKRNVHKSNVELVALDDDLARLEAKLSRLTDADEREITENRISVLRRRKAKLNSEAEGSLYRKLKRLCWEFANLYYAYMTLSKNYYVHESDMYMCVINNYQSLFSTLKSLHDFPCLQSALLAETKAVMDDIGRYVDSTGQSDGPLLAEHPGYRNAVYECSYYWINVIDEETEAFYRRVCALEEAKYDDVEAVRQFADDFSQAFLRYHRLAEHYRNVMEQYCEQLDDDLVNRYLFGSDEWELWNKKLLEVSGRKNVLHIALSSFMIRIFRKISGIEGMSRTILLRGTVEVRKKYSEMVDYYQRSAPALLSDLYDYRRMQEESVVIALMEMMAQFEFLKRERIICYEKLEMTDSPGERHRLIYDVCCDYAYMFTKYSSFGIEDYEYLNALVSYFSIYLLETLQMMPEAADLIRKTTSKVYAKWKSRMEALIRHERVKEYKKIEWRKLSVQMKKIME